MIDRPTDERTDRCPTDRQTGSWGSFSCWRYFCGFDLGIFASLEDPRLLHHMNVCIYGASSTSLPHILSPSVQTQIQHVPALTICLSWLNVLMLFQQLKNYFIHFQTGFPYMYCFYIYRVFQNNCIFSNPLKPIPNGWPMKKKSGIELKFLIGNCQFF